MLKESLLCLVKGVSPSIYVYIIITYFLCFCNSYIIYSYITSMCKLFNQTDVFSATFVVMAGTPINLLNIVCNVYTVLDKCVYLI